MAKKIKEFKRCPRCDTKTVIYNDKCPACGLIYSRLINASNKEAKKVIKRGEKNKVICDKTLPNDVNKWKLFFMSLFLGMFGGHYYYVGKYKTGVVFTASTVLLMVGAAIAQNDSSVWQKYYFWMWFFILPASGCLVALAIDWVRILANNFRVPIALKEDIVAETIKAEDKKEVIAILEEVNKKVSQDKSLETSVEVNGQENNAENLAQTQKLNQNKAKNLRANTRMQKRRAKNRWKL